MLEASALDLVGKTNAASRLLDAALTEAEARADPLELRVQLALASARARHALVEPRPARERLGLAIGLAARSDDPVLQLQVLATASELRLDPTGTSVALDDVLERMSPSMLASKLPTLCAAAAQFGVERPRLINLAISVVGLPGLQRDELRQLTAALEKATGRPAPALIQSRPPRPSPRGGRGRAERRR